MRKSKYNFLPISAIEMFRKKFVEATKFYQVSQLKVD